MRTTEEVERTIRAAIHEAGHGAIASYFAFVEGVSMLRVRAASIVPGPRTTGGVCFYTVPEEHVDRSAIEIMTMTYAGDEAVKLWAGGSVAFDPLKLEQRFKTLRSVEKLEGGVKHDIDRAPELCPDAFVYERCRHRAAQLLQRPPIRAATRAIAEALLDRAEIDGDEIARLFMEQWNRNQPANTSRELSI